MGEAVFSAGDAADKFYILASGELSVSGDTTRMADGGPTGGQPTGTAPPPIEIPAPVLLGKVTAGEGFGETALLNRVPSRTKSVACASDKCEVVEILAEDFLRLVEKSRCVRESFERLALRRTESNRRMIQDRKGPAGG